LALACYIFREQLSITSSGDLGRWLELEDRLALFFFIQPVILQAGSLIWHRRLPLPGRVVSVAKVNAEARVAEPAQQSEASAPSGTILGTSHERT
jgi:hypothetical protein